MLSPKKTKFRKYHKGRIRGFATSGLAVSFGTFGMQALEPGRITARQIEATRRVLSRRIKKIGKIWIRIFPDIPVTAKPAEIRMGKGKGAVSHWVARIKPGKILFEISGVDKTTAESLFKSGGSKLPIKTQLVVAAPKENKNKNES